MILTGVILFSIALVAMPVFLWIIAIKENKEIKYTRLKRNGLPKEVPGPKIVSGELADSSMY